MDARVLAATRAQLEKWRSELAAGAERVGWKVGLTTPAAQQQLKISSPAVGYLTSATLAGFGARISLAGGTRVMVEPEIAIEIGAAGEATTLGAAMEVVDIDAPLEDLERIVAGNIFHRAVLLGGPRRGMPPPAEATVLVGGAVREQAEVEFDETYTLELVAEALASAGEALEPGDTIIAGSLTDPVPVEPGDFVAVSLGALGFVQAQFTE